MVADSADKAISDFDSAVEELDKKPESNLTTYLCETVVRLSSAGFKLIQIELNEADKKKANNKEWFSTVSDDDETSYTLPVCYKIMCELDDYILDAKEVIEDKHCNFYQPYSLLPYGLKPEYDSNVKLEIGLSSNQKSPKKSFKAKIYPVKFLHDGHQSKNPEYLGAIELLNKLNNWGDLDNKNPISLEEAHWQIEELIGNMTYHDTFLTDVTGLIQTALIKCCNSTMTEAGARTGYPTSGLRLDWINDND